MTMNFVKYSCLCAAILALAAGALAAKPPLFELKDLDGNTYELKNDLGKSVIVIDFWATWCKPCMRELPHINELTKKYADKGLKVFAISIDDTSTGAQVKPTVKKYGFEMNILLDPTNNVVRKFNASRNVPYLMIIGADGEVVREFSGYKPGDEKLIEEIVLEQLKKAPAPAAGDSPGQAKAN
jgi:cytochrome c biogenesis protein CcmG, thiol:disulfide interchange protein DsbE